MKGFRCACLLPVLTALAWGVAQGKPAAPPKEPDALVRSLYTQVVARHPLGIPYGADKDVFAPYLSTTLLHGFDVHIACIGDWYRQNPDPNLKPPGLFEDGIFSGSSEEGNPHGFHVGKTELQEDGSYRVHVKLTRHATPDTPEAWSWHVAAVVVRENGRPVVEDVLFLKDNDREINWRLSDGLTAGCDGPRWVGRDDSTG